MNIVILDDYQDAVRKLPCAAKLDPYPAKVFTNTVTGVGQLSIRLRDGTHIKNRFREALLGTVRKLLRGVRRALPTNSMTSRTTPAIVLGPTGNLQGTYKFFSLTTGTKLKRRQFTPYPMPDTVIARVK